MASKAEGNIALTFQPISVSFSPEAFDSALQEHGVKLVHYRALRCPVGMVDRYDSRRVHEDHSGCSNGHVYIKVATVTGIFTGNSNKSNQNDVGLLEDSAVTVTTPRFYDDSEEEVMVAPFDRFYLNEEVITVPHQQLVEAHITGKDKLSFPVVRVFDIIDSTGKKYSNSEFSVDNQGMIVWNGSGPGFNPETKKGTIYAIRYAYRPFWYVDRVIHEVRIAQVDTGLGREVMRMPQQFSLLRENVFEKEDRDDQAPNPNSVRQVKAARSDLFGSR